LIDKLAFGYVPLTAIIISGQKESSRTRALVNVVFTRRDVLFSDCHNGIA